MACPICKRYSCTISFHSIEEQERYDERKNMSDDVDVLRVQIQELKEENKILQAKIEELENDLQSK